MAGRKTGLSSLAAEGCPSTREPASRWSSDGATGDDVARAPRGEHDVVDLDVEGHRLLIAAVGLLDPLEAVGPHGVVVQLYTGGGRGGQRHGGGRSGDHEREGGRPTGQLLGHRREESAWPGSRQVSALNIQGPRACA